MSEQSATCDLLVIGGGIAGLSAAMAAAEGGISVVLTEQSHEIGGNARLAAGMFLGANDPQALHRYIPDGDERLQALLCSDYDETLGWLESFGLPIGPQVDLGDFRKIRPMAIGEPGMREGFVEGLAGAAAARGATIRTGVAVAGLAREGDGYRATLAGGETIVARAVVLATGGFASSASLLREHMGDDARWLRTRSRPGANGAGLTFARALGAATGGDMAAFYGHCMVDCPLGPQDWQPLTPYFSRLSILVNRAGRRFTDESASLLEELNAQAGFHQPGGVFWLIFDQRIRVGESVDTGSDAVLPKFDWVERARAAGAPIIETTTLNELLRRLALEGVDAAALADELARFNKACHAGNADALSPPKTQNAFAIEVAPFFAVRCTAGITATCGGIAIDARTRVLDSNGRPLPGLFAAGVDAGGVFGKTYGGFLTWSAISGRRAGIEAAAQLAERRRP